MMPQNATQAEVKDALDGVDDLGVWAEEKLRAEKQHSASIGDLVDMSAGKELEDGKRYSHLSA